MPKWYLQMCATIVPWALMCLYQTIVSITIWVQLCFHTSSHCCFYRAARRAKRIRQFLAQFLGWGLQGGGRPEGGSRRSCYWSGSSLLGNTFGKWVSLARARFIVHRVSVRKTRRDPERGRDRQTVQHPKQASSKPYRWESRSKT